MEMISLSLPLVNIEETRTENEFLIHVFASKLLLPIPETVEVIKNTLMKRYRDPFIIEEKWSIPNSPLTGTIRLVVSNEENDGELIASGEQAESPQATHQREVIAYGGRREVIAYDRCNQPSQNDNVKSLTAITASDDGCCNQPSQNDDGELIAYDKQAESLRGTQQREEHSECFNANTLKPLFTAYDECFNAESSVPLIVQIQEQEDAYASLNAYSNQLKDPRDTTSRNLGAEGEAEVYKRLVNLFPKLEVKLVSEVAHVADIHIIDDIRKLTFVVEVKNKTRLTAEDIDKFKRDLDEMAKANSNRVIGLFISLICPIPRLGLVNISSDSCYLAKEYTSDSCIDLVVRTYRSVYTKRETMTKTDSVKYEIPINVYKLLSELRMQSAGIESAKEIYCKQIEINKQSTANMYDLLAKADMQKHLIDFINNEFGEVVGSVNVVNNDEELLREYLANRTRKTIRQRDIRSLFPSIASTLTLDEIWNRYGPQ